MLLILYGLMGFTMANKLVLPQYMCDSLVEKPVITFDTELEDMVVPAGVPVNLKCSVYGSPQAAITWYHRGRRLESHDPAGLELALPNKMLASGIVESTLHIPCMDQKSSGDYVCVATSPCGGESIVSEANVKVSKTNRVPLCSSRKASTVAAPRIAATTVQRLELLGNPVQLLCRAKGMPQPKIEWFMVDEDEKLQPIAGKSDYLPLANGDLLVVGKRDVVSESFRCIVSNEHGQDFADSTVMYVDE